jgi:hypothetical protein
MANSIAKQDVAELNQDERGKTIPRRGTVGHRGSQTN